MYIKMLALAVLFTFGASTYAQDKIPDALAKGNALALCQLAGQKIDLDFLDEEKQLSKDECKSYLERFFNTHKPISFEKVHAGNSNNGETYAIGNLKTSTGTYRVTYYTKQTNNSIQLTHLIIEE